VSGAVDEGVEKDQAEAIFELLAKFADYGFNKSHAAAYALVAYQTAYMKANYPVEFLAASMTYDMGNTDKLAEFRSEAQRLGIRVEPPSVNRSGVTFDVAENTIFYALAALKGVGRQAVDSIVEARGDRPFRDLTDFAARVNPKAINKRVLESLAAAGAFDALDSNRARVHAGVDVVLAAAQRRHEDAEIGQNDMFGGGATREALPLQPAEPWLPAEKLQREFDAIGFFLSGHPLDDYKSVLEKLRVHSWVTFCNAIKRGETAGKVAATVVSRAERRTKTGNKMGILEFSDPSGHYEAVIFQEGLLQFRDLLEPGAAVLMTLTAEAQGDDVRARIASVERLDAAAEKMQKGLRVFLRSDQPIEGVAKRLEPAQPARSPGDKGDAEISMILILDDGASEVEVKLPGRYKVSPQIAGAIKAVPGVIEVQAL
jgi:DNA polymerase-3 subunit alpha